jgi:hypothetical protein
MLYYINKFINKFVLHADVSQCVNNCNRILTKIVRLLHTWIRIRLRVIR